MLRTRMPRGLAHTLKVFDRRPEVVAGVGDHRPRLHWPQHAPPRAIVFAREDPELHHVHSEPSLRRSQAEIHAPHAGRSRGPRGFWR